MRPKLSPGAGSWAGRSRAFQALPGERRGDLLDAPLGLAGLGFSQIADSEHLTTSPSVHVPVPRSPSSGLLRCAGFALSDRPYAGRSMAIASIEMSRPRGSATLAGAERAGGGSGMRRA